MPFVSPCGNSQKLPALRAEVSQEAADKTPPFILLGFVASSVSLISAESGEKSLAPLLLNFPRKPLTGFRGIPDLSSEIGPRRGQLRRRTTYDALSMNSTLMGLFECFVLYFVIRASTF